MFDKIITLQRLAPFLILITGFLVILSCTHKLDPAPNPIPEWIDNDADSATLTITVQTEQGILLAGQFINLALSADSLASVSLIRQGFTDGAGRAIFRKLYPRKIFFNCNATYMSQPLFGSGKINVPPFSIRDTILTVR